MKTLVLGGNGFIGSYVVDALIAQGHSVSVFDRQPERFRPPRADVDYRFGDFSDRMALIDALAGTEVVLHLVSSTFPGTADLDPKTDVQNNLVGTINLLDSMVSLGIRRIMFLSSGGTVYGIPESLPIAETHPLRPINSYGIVKVSIEHYLEMYRRTRGISPVIVRASNPYGPRQAHTGVQGVISTFLRRVLTDAPIEVWGDGSVVRDYIHVGDLAELCALAAVGGTEGAYNAGSGKGTSINEIIRLVGEVTGAKIEAAYKPGRAIDVPKSVLDVTRAAADFDWRSATALPEGMAETWRWLQATH
ncbi:MAG: NAD-dependent epimerase [Cereibacter sphaeroides]|uniref:UDP-glucose 4-epimerase n=1 Tax=Cereibacter sphaeroides TaxID=1063 RepID=A0A2W5S4I8_CERSP|nr:MAG: NAD-dependent epimerase [Cereibacter sphaeroides]